MKYPRLEAIALFIIFTFIMVYPVYADSYKTTIVEKSNSAMVMATSNLHLDPRYIPLQGSIAVGSMKGVSAIGFAAGKRFSKTGGLFSGSLGYDGDLGLGAGYSFRF